MALVHTDKVVLGSIAFAIFWVLAVFPAVPFLPIGRTAGSLLGAILMVIFKVTTPEQAYAAIDLSVLGLLFGTMVVGFYLERADMFKYLRILLSWRSRGAKDLLCRICIVSAISSALFTNDTTCIVLTEFVLKIARQNNIPPYPFLLALASSANIGSSATPIGNPQNLIIAIQSRISFGEFLLGILPAMLAGIIVNISILLCMYWSVLTVKKDEEVALAEVIPEEDATSRQFSQAAMSHLLEGNPMLESVNVQIPNSNVEEGKTTEILKISTSLRENDMPRTSSGGLESARSLFPIEVAGDGLFSETIEEGRTKSGINGGKEMIAGTEDVTPQQSVEEKKGLTKKWKRLSWKTCVYFVTLGMLITLLMGFNMSWTALTAALALVVLDHKDAKPCLEKVSYSLLVFFCGMFITIDGFNKTGIPGTFWSITEPHARITHVSGVVVLALVILVLSNVASNVPTVLLLGARIATSTAATSPGKEKAAWLILAWVSTVAGNLSLLGSAANLIVCEQARNSQSFGYTLSFWTHLKFGLPSTLIVTAIGLTLIRV